MIEGSKSRGGADPYSPVYFPKRRVLLQHKHPVAQQGLQQRAHRHPSVQFLHDQTHPQEHSGHEGSGQLKHDVLRQQPPSSQQDDWHLKQEGCPLQHEDWQLKHCVQEHLHKFEQPAQEHLRNLKQLKQPKHRGQEQEQLSTQLQH